jgi:hypothetical protein
MQVGIVIHEEGKRIYLSNHQKFSVPCEETELSTARIDVVPTVQIRFLRTFAIYNITGCLSNF